jgi:hypothetical protein
LKREGGAVCEPRRYEGCVRGGTKMTTTGGFRSESGPGRSKHSTGEEEEEQAAIVAASKRRRRRRRRRETVAKSSSA